LKKNNQKFRRKFARYVDFDGKNLLIKFSDSSESAFYELVKYMDKETDALFSASRKAWICDPNEAIIQQLKTLKFKFIRSAAPLIDPVEIPERKIQRKTVDQSELVGLRKNQVEAVEFMEATRARCIIGDPMGYGKTIEVLGFLKIHRNYRPCIVICPATVKIKWRREVKKWLGEDWEILSGQKTIPLNSDSSFIINYEILKFWEKELLKIEHRITVGDEVQYITNPEAIRTKSFQKLAKQTLKKIFISGTPIRKNAREFWTALNLTDPKTFNSRRKFLDRYCNPRHDGWGWKYDGASNISELRSLIEPIMIRRPKTDMPKKTRSMIPLPMNEKLYKKAENELKSIFSEYGYKCKIAEKKIEEFRQTVYAVKKESVYRWINDILQTEEKHIIFAWHRWVIDDLFREFRKISVKLDGKAANRQHIIDQFQSNSSKRLIIMNTRLGVGFDLTAARTSTFVEIVGSPGDLEQAEDRIQRCTQKAKSVVVYYPVAENTIEEDIFSALERSFTMYKKVLDGDNTKFSTVESFDSTKILAEKIMERG